MATPGGDGGARAGRLRVGLIYNLKGVAESVPADGGPGEGAPVPQDFWAECDSEATIAAIRSALERRHAVIPVEADEDAFETLRTERPDVVFNVAEGLWGEARESQIPAILEMLRIPYTGSDPLTLALSLDKARTKQVLEQAGIPTAPFFTARRAEEAEGKLGQTSGGHRAVTLPAVVKPLHEGSSKGIVNASLVHTREELRAQVARCVDLYRQPVIVESFLPGREFTVAILGNPNPLGRIPAAGLEILPIVEIRFDTLPAGSAPIYSYEAKWVWDTPERPLAIFDCPARVCDVLDRRLREVAARAFVELGCRDWCRIDLRLDAAGEPNVIEVNPLPGILPNPEENSCFPKAARAAGYSYEGLILKVLDAALARTGVTARRSVPCPA